MNNDFFTQSANDEADVARCIGLYILDAVRFAVTLATCYALFNGWLAFVAFVLAWIAGNALGFMAYDTVSNAAVKIGFAALDGAAFIKSRFFAR